MIVLMFENEHDNDYEILRYLEDNYMKMQPHEMEEELQYSFNIEPYKAEEYVANFIIRKLAVPYEIESFMKDDISLPITKEAYNCYMNLFKLAKAAEEDLMDFGYKIRKTFYANYKPFCDKCVDIMNNDWNISGYKGLRDFERIKIKEYCKKVDYNFPYAWKR